MTAPPLQVLAGKKLVRIEASRIDELCAVAERVLVDVGTGDASTAHRLAKAHPEWLVIGVDPAWQRMVETAVRSARKEAKGGAPNLLLVNASIESVPEALHGRPCGASSSARTMSARGCAPWPKTERRWRSPSGRASGATRCRSTSGTCRS